MAVYFVTGKLGGGKTLASVGKIRDYLLKGLPVATNLDLNLEKLLGPKKRNTLVYRLPDKPTSDDLLNIGKGNNSYDELKNGLLVLDECGTWFNSRNWNDKNRQSVIDWFLHARKLGWDIIFIVQDISIVDKQAREALAEHVVYCRRLDRIRLPFIGSLFKLATGINLTGPKVHIGIVKYGDQQNSLTVDKWWYRGRDLYQAYDTKQVFRQSDDGVYQLLPSWYSTGRYLPVKNLAWIKRRIRHHLLRKPWLALFSSMIIITPVSAFAAVYINNLKHTGKLETHVSTIQSSQLHKKTTTPITLPIPEWIKGLRITGSITGTSTIYLLETHTTGIGYTSTELTHMGYSYIQQGRCRLELIGVGWTHAVTCGNKKPRDSASVGEEGT